MALNLPHPTRPNFMGYAILRMQKLKSAHSVRRSMQHAFREKDTPNADPERTPENTHIGANNTDEAMQKFKDAMPDKVRKNAVLAVEYLITASPETIKDKSRQQQDDYFRDALHWLEKKHGKDNVLYAGIHRDEQTPHMYAYVIPKDDRDKLNCRAFFGEKNALSVMQTDFAEQVGQKHGLERGVEGSRARHTSIQQYYARVSTPTAKIPSVDVPEGKLLESKETYGDRVAKAVLEQVWGTVKAAEAKAKGADEARWRAQDMEKLVQNRENLLKVEREKLKFQEDKARWVAGVILRGGEPLESLQATLRNSVEAKQQISGKDLER